MLLIFFSFQADVFEKANEFIVKKNPDSAAHYLAKAYEKYPVEVENIIYISYMEDTTFGSRLVMKLFPRIPESRVVSQLGLYELIKSKRYEDIASLYESDSSRVAENLRPFMRFYYYIERDNLLSALDVADSLLILYQFSSILSDDLFSKLVRVFVKDVAYQTCSRLLAGPCVRYLSAVVEDDTSFVIENYTYLSYYGLLRPMRYYRDYNRYLDRLRAYGYALRSNYCRDAGTLRSVFVDALYIHGSYAEADSLHSILRWIEEDCGDSLRRSISISRAYLLDAEDMTGYAIDTLRSIPDLSPDYLVPLLINYGLDEEAIRIMDSLSRQGLMDRNLVLDMELNHNCRRWYSQNRYRKVIERCAGTVEAAYSYIMLGKRDSGMYILQLNRSDTIRDNYSDYWNAGWFALLFGKTDSALYYTRKALEYRPENPFLTMNLGSIFFARGLVDSALYYYRKSFDYNVKRRTYHWTYFFDTWRDDIKLISRLYGRDSGLVRKLMGELRKKAPR